MAFTARWLDALKAKGKTPEEHFEPDADYRGLAIRVAPSGRKTWTFHYTFEKPTPEKPTLEKPHKKRRRLDFGHYPVMPLKEAHHRAKEYRQALESQPPIDPRSIKAGTAEAPADVPTVNDLIRLYVADLRRSPKPLRTLDHIEWMLTSHVGAHVGTVTLPNATRQILKGVIDKVRDRGAHSMAVALHSRTRLMFGWGVQAGELDANPMLQMETPEAAPVKENARPLTEAEVKAFWHGVADVLPEYCRVPYTRILKLCLLTGCRVSEAAEMDVANMVEGVWTIPASRAKNSKPLAIPLNADMRAIIGDTKAGNPWGAVIVKGKPRRIVGQMVSDTFCKFDVPAALETEDYTVHGLRRTVASQMDEMGIPESTIALCLNHSDGKRKSVTRGYIKPSAAVERARELAKLALKRDALNRWAERLREIIA
jgi:integrase